MCVSRNERRINERAEQRANALLAHGLASATTITLL